MREILFRGKHAVSGEWIFGDLLCSNGNYYIHEKGKPIVSYVSPMAAFGTVGQYTGLTDKNGKKIFEGDIIKDKELRRIYMIGYNEDLMKYAFLYYHKELKNIYCGGFVSKSDGKSIEVIGNIHDNPELLEDIK